MQRYAMRFLFLFALFFQTGTTLLADTIPKLQLLYVEMEHCPWCHRMNEEVFENPEIAKQLRRMYTIQKRRKDAQELPDFVHPRYYPTTYILSADGQKLLDELPGYMDPKRFLDYLKALYELEKEELSTVKQE